MSYLIYVRHKSSFAQFFLLILCRHWTHPGDPKLLVTSQSPWKVRIEITLPHRLQKRKYSGASNLGKIYAIVSEEIVTTLPVLDHRDTDVYL